MKDFNQYIIEKLKINKDTKLQNRSFSKGDKTISVSINKTMGCLELRVYPPFKVLQYSENSITYKTTKEQTITQDIFLNSNRYIQMRINSFNAIFLSMKEGMDFLNNLILYYKEKSKVKNLLLDIFDKEEKDNIENLSYNIFSTENELKELYKEIKEERIDEKLKINKNTKVRDISDNPHKEFNSYGDFVMYIANNAKFYGIEGKQDNYWITLKKEDSEYPQIKLGYLKDKKIFGTIKSNGANPDELGKELIIIVGKDKYEYDHLDTFDFAEGSGQRKVVDVDDLIPNPYNLDLIMSYLEKL